MMEKALSSVAEWSTRAYDGFMQAALEPRSLRTYYRRHGAFLERMNDRHWHLSQKDMRKVFRKSPLEVLGREKVDGAAFRVIQWHALKATAVTILCALPQSWIMWPLMIVDVIYYQHQLFKVSQELCILYLPKSKWSVQKFDYKNVANLVLKIEGAFLARQSKKAVGFVVQKLARKGARVVRGPFKNVLRQLMKWTGVSFSKDFAEKFLEMVVVAICAVVAGLITYWMFLPAAYRCKRYFLEKLEEDS